MGRVREAGKLESPAIERSRNMIREEVMYGLEAGSSKWGYEITPGKKYDVRIMHRKIAHDAWLEEEFHIVDDSGNKAMIDGMILSQCLARRHEWRERQIESIGI
jgi:hypothetical protein